ncbi:copper chaperone PCu(A)C [Herminiimonas sp. CN]|uniref:copper chaperone PCu(A)C n=1 Tax=Herminiimonas sp. CN TaxID=1349818 RepID=UPI000473852A|nr:copper chaperone PCu(A)C [Herminiimonas sp. CN]
MKQLILASLLALSATAVLAQVQIGVKDPWVRATVQQQKTTGAFMQLSARQDARLVEVRSPAAATVEIHEMSMANNVMKMRSVAGLDLPAGQTIGLKPGGYHIMLINLKQQIKDGDLVPLTLVVEGKDKKRQTIELQVPARPLNSAGAMKH